MLVVLLAFFVVWILADRWITFLPSRIAIVGLLPPLIVGRLYPPNLIGVDVGSIALMVINGAIVYLIEDTITIVRSQRRYKRWFVASLLALVIALMAVGLGALIKMGNTTQFSSALLADSFSRLRAGESVNLFAIFLVFAVTRMWHPLSPDTTTIAGIVCALLTTAWHRRFVTFPSLGIDALTVVVFATLAIVSARAWGVVTRPDEATLHHSV